jgi:hypothetical protein
MIMAVMMLVVMIVPVIMAAELKHIVGMIVAVVMIAIGTVHVAGLAMGRVHVCPGMVIMAMPMVVTVIMMVMIMNLVAVVVVLAVDLVLSVAVIMAVLMIMAVAPVLAAMVVGAALGPEGPCDLRGRAALSADHVRQDMVVLDVEGIGGDFRRGVPVADVPGHAHQPERVLGAHLDQILGGSRDQHKTAILQLQRVAFRQHARLVEIEQDVAAMIGLQHGAPALAVLMGEHNGVDDLVGPDGGLADDAGGALHGTILGGAATALLRTM